MYEVESKTGLLHNIFTIKSHKTKFDNRVTVFKFKYTKKTQKSINIQDSRSYSTYACFVFRDQRIF